MGGWFQSARCCLPLSCPGSPALVVCVDQMVRETCSSSKSQFKGNITSGCGIPLPPPLLDSASPPSTNFFFYPPSFPSSFFPFCLFLLFSISSNIILFFVCLPICRYTLFLLLILQLLLFSFISSLIRFYLTVWLCLFLLPYLYLSMHTRAFISSFLSIYLHFRLNSSPHLCLSLPCN